MKQIIKITLFASAETRRTWTIMSCYKNVKFKRWTCVVSKWSVKPEDCTIRGSNTRQKSIQFSFCKITVVFILQTPARRVLKHLNYFYTPCMQKRWLYFSPKIFLYSSRSVLLFKIVQLIFFAKKIANHNKTCLTFIFLKNKLIIWKVRFPKTYCHQNFNEFS